jgi:hypothetical protein
MSSPLRAVGSERLSLPEGQSIYSCMPLFPRRDWLGIVPAIMMGGRIVFAPRFSASHFWEMRAISVRMWRAASSPRCRFC